MNSKEIFDYIMLAPFVLLGTFTIFIIILKNLPNEWFDPKLTGYVKLNNEIWEITSASIMKDRRSSFEESPISYAGCWYAQLKHIHTGETKSGVVPPKWVYKSIEECKLNS